MGDKMLDYEVITTVELSAETRGKELNHLLLACQKQQIINDIMSVFQNDETLSGHISSEVDIQFISMEKIELEYMFDCHDEGEDEAEQFSAYCVRAVQKELREKGYQIENIHCMANETDMYWGKEIAAEYGKLGRWPKATYAHTDLSAPSKVIFPASYIEAQKLFGGDRPASLGDCLQWHLPYLVALLPVQDTESGELLDELWEHMKSMFQEDHGLTKYLAVLEADRPQCLADALVLAVSRNEYEWVGSTPAEYGKKMLEQSGLTRGQVDAMSAYTDFDALGRSYMEQNHIQQTGFGLIQRLREPLFICQSKNASIVHCIDGLTEYAAELLQRDAKKGKAEIPFLRNLCEVLWNYWDLKSENLGTCEEFFAVFDRRTLEAKQAQREWNPTLEQVNGVIQGLYSHSIDLISSHGYEETVGSVEEYKRLMRETTVFWNHRSPLPDHLCAQIDVKLQEQKEREMYTEQIIESSEPGCDMCMT
jgi:hypothetical protein